MTNQQNAESTIIAHYQGESHRPTSKYILHEDEHIPRHAQLEHRTQLAKMSFDDTLDLAAVRKIFFVFENNHRKNSVSLSQPKSCFLERTAR